MDPEGGGPSQGIRNLTPALAQQGIAAEVVSLDAPDATFLQNQGLVVHALGQGSKWWGHHPPLRSWLDQNAVKYDAVILHGLWLYPGFALWQSLKRRSGAPPYFIYPHGMLDPWFQLAPERKWKALRNRIYWKMVESRVVRDAAGLLFTCAEERRLAALTFPDYHPQRELNVGYGVPAPPADSEETRLAFAQRCPELAAGQPFLLFLSRIHFKKGVDLLLLAYADLVQSHPDLPPLVIAGPLDSAYAREMRALAEKLVPARATADGQVPRVLFPGMLQGPAKWGAFYGCEAFVLPSHQENFGIAVVEALACGKPVLISDKVNICQEIEAAGVGWVRPDTVQGTKALLEIWLDRRSSLPDPELVKACYCQHFGVEQAASVLRETLEGVVRGKLVTL